MNSIDWTFFIYENVIKLLKLFIKRIHKKWKWKTQNLGYRKSVWGMDWNFNKNDYICFLFNQNKDKI